MSHEIESIAWTNEKPWHSLGFNVADTLTPQEMIKAAQLDWTVDTQPMFLSDGNEVTGHRALVRSSDKSILDVVGNAYRPIQNEQAFRFFKEFVEAGGAKMETAGSLRGGKYVWGLANLNSSFKMKGNDEIKGYLLVGCPHEQGKSLIIKFTTIRVVCNNTLTLALRSKGKNEYRFSHRMDFTDDSMSKAKEVLGIARSQLDEFEANAKKIQKIKLNDEECVKILVDIFGGNETSPRIEAIMNAYKLAPGAQPGNGYGLLNGVTYWADHMAARTVDKRLANSWIGKTANQKEEVLDTLLKIAA